MGEIYRHHITMLVSDEQEDAIRFLFKENKWKCWMKALCDDTVNDVLDNGFANIFPDSCDDTEDGENTSSTNILHTDHLDNTELDADDPDDDAGDDDAEDNHLDDVDDETAEDNVEINKKLGADSDNVNQDSVLLNSKEEIKLNSTKTKDYSKTVLKQPRKRNSMIKQKSANKKKKTVSTEVKVKVDRKEIMKVDNEDKGEVNKKEKGKIKCSYCDMYVGNQYILKRHCQRRHKDVWFEFECKDCPSRFKTKEELWEHRNTVNHKLPENNPKREQKKHHTPEELAGMGHVKCQACDKYYPNNRLLRRHLNSIHKDLLPKWNCQVCGVEYETREELWKHKRESKHSTSVWTLDHYQCDSCGKIYNRYDSFRLHKKVACGKKENELEELRVHPCDICGLTFKSVHHVKAHKRGVHLNAPEVCDICGAVCKNKRALSSHQKRHDLKNRKYACSECDRAFFNATILKQHIRTHTKEKPYKCPLCTYTSAVKQNISKHSLKIHKVKSQAIDLRLAKEKNDTQDNGYSDHLISGQLEHHYEITGNHPLDSHETYDDRNMVVLDGDKMTMKMPTAISNMVLPPSSTSYLEMMNYNMHPTDYNVQPNIPLDPTQYQY